MYNNIYNIINYDNGILLKPAKDKILFLSFCMEFKRFNEFYINDSQVELKSYLPIQLDASCKGFQHLALLSNEEGLFKELNLISENGDDANPRYFYNFILYSL